MRGDFGTFLAKSTKEQKAEVFAKTRCEAENKMKKEKSVVFSKKRCEAENNIKEKKRKRCFRKNNIIKKKTRKRKPPSEKDGGKSTL